MHAFNGETLKLKINPFDKGNPMSLKDAAKVATVVAFVIWILSFLANTQWVIILEDPAAWAFEALKTYAVSWAGTFIGLAGLEKIVERGSK